MRQFDAHVPSLHAHVFAQVAKLDGHSPATLPFAQSGPYASVMALAQFMFRQSMHALDLDAGSAEGHA